MRKCILVIACVFLLLPISLLAQEAPKAEIFGGYSLVHTEGENFHGWNASVAANANKWVGVVADFSGYYKNGAKVHGFLFGPKFTYRDNERVTPFVHSLFGVLHASNGGSDNAFGMALGGGIDVKAAESVAIRVFEADYLLDRFGGFNHSDVRFSFGVVFRIK
jgi:opacity protein-like surface antigen